MAVLMLAAVFRLAYLIELWRSPLFLLNVLPGLDMATYYSLALEFAHGRLPSSAFFQPPLYALVLASLIRGVGQSVAALTVAQTLLGVLACILLYELGRRLASPTVGLVAAALYAAYPLAWYYTGLLLSENLLVVLLLALSLVAAEALEHGRARAWVGVGLLCGLATLTKPNAVVALPLLLGAAFVASPRAVSAPTASLACVTCGGLLLPAIVFNSLHAGVLQFVSGQGSHLWLAGNSAYATGLYQLPCGPALAPTSPDFWALQGRKVALFFSNQEFGNNTWPAVFQAHLWLPMVGFGVLAATGLLGLASAVRWSRRWVAFGIVLSSYGLSIVAFAIVGRYRLPAAALLCVPAASLVVAVRRLPRRRLVTGVACVAALMLAANVAVPPDVSVPFAHANAAAVFSAAGQTPAAQTELQLAHAARLDVEAHDRHGCSQLPPF